MCVPQVRRSTYHDVVRVDDLGGLGVDTGGVQVYSINNARVGATLGFYTAPTRPSKLLATAHFSP